MKKIYVTLLCLACLCAPARSQAFGSDPVAVVSDFYRWYLERIHASPSIEGDDAIYTYVDKELVDYVVKYRTSLNVDYFKQTDHDFPEETEVVTGKPIRMQEGVIAVPVTLRPGFEEYTNIVFVKPHGKGYRIFKVCDTSPYM